MTARLTPAMLDALAAAADDHRRRLPSAAHTNTVAALVQRGLATPGARDNYLTAAGATALRQARPGTPDQVDIPTLMEDLDQEHGDPSARFPHLCLWADTVTRYYPNAPSPYTSDLLEVPNVAVFYWACSGCTSDNGEHDEYLDAHGAALRHAAGPSCVHR